MAGGILDKIGRGVSSVVSHAVTAEEAKAAEGIGPFLNIVNNVTDALGSLIQPFTSVQTEVINLTKALGLAGTNVMALSERIITQNKAMSLSMNYGVSNEEMIKLQTSILNGLERNVSIDMAGSVLRNERGEVINKNYDSEFENMIAAGTIFDEKTLSEIYKGFDQIGISMGSAAKATGKLYAEAGKYGINLTKYAQNFSSNLSKVQTYNFRNGVNGLQQMAKKATEIRQDMEQTFKFADKVGSVTGAVEAAANLQVLGGSFTALANPFAMLNESLTNVEGLQDRMNKMAQGRARYNQRTHQIEMDPVTRMQMKRAAESMGIDPNNFIDTAFAYARRGEIERQIDLNGVGGMKEEVLNLVKNVGTINSETGVAGATIAGKFRTIGEIGASQDLQNQLIAENKSQSDDIKDIAKSVLGIEGLLKGRKEQVRNQAAENKIKEGVMGSTMVQDIVDALRLGITPDLISAVGKIQFPIESLEATLVGALTQGVGGIVSTLNTGNFDDFLRRFDSEWTATFGSSPFWDSAKDVLMNVLDDISYGLGDVEAILSARGYDISGALNRTVPSIGGREGQPTGPTGATFNGNVSPRVIPVVVVNPGAPGTAPAINGNNNSIPGITVSTNEPNSNGAAPGNQGPTEVILHITGNMTMDVNGTETGKKLGEIDIVKLIEDKPNLRNEIAKLISDALAKQLKQGQSAPQ